MACRFVWLKIIVLLNVVDSLNVSLSINNSERIVRKVSDDLNLLCSVTLQNGQSTQFDMNWKLPKKIDLIDHRVTIKTSYNHVLLKMSDLQEDDSGDYVCTASNRELGVTQKNITLVVKQKKGCSEKHFRCNTGHCIPARYVCDGFTDCPSDASDEALHKCGSDPCAGKIRCSDGRCLDRYICCDPYLEPNCPTAHVLPCCQRFIHSTYSQVQPSLEQQRRYDSDLGFLQSTIYTVIGCAVAFVFIVTIMVIAVCRVHLKRSAMTPHPRSRALSTSSTAAPISAAWEHQRHLHDTDIVFRDVGDPFIYSAATPTPPGSANVLVAYNINSGIQFVGRLIKPPSYSEIAQELTVPEGPPPPYQSTDNLYQHPIQQQLAPCSLEQLNQNSNTDPPVISLHRFSGPSYNAALRPNIIVNRLSDSE